MSQVKFCSLPMTSSLVFCYSRKQMRHDLCISGTQCLKGKTETLSQRENKRKLQNFLSCEDSQMQQRNQSKSESDQKPRASNHSSCQVSGSLSPLDLYFTPSTSVFHQFCISLCFSPHSHLPCHIAESERGTLETWTLNTIRPYKDRA
jgi:hypothetical protein